MRRWWRLLLVVLLGCCCAGPEARSDKFAVKNKSRRNGELQEGDVAEVVCVSCGEKSLNVTAWEAHGNAVVVDAYHGNATAVVELKEAGIVALEPLVDEEQASGEMLVLSVGKRSVGCYEWKSCFTYSKNATDAECVRVWFNQTSTTLYLRVWLGGVVDGETMLGSMDQRSESDQVLTYEMYLLGESPKASILAQPLTGPVESAVRLLGSNTNHVVEGEYMRQGHYWLFTLEAQNALFAGQNVGVDIARQSVNVLGCSAVGATMMLDMPKYDPPVLASSAGSIGFADSSAIHQDPCTSTFIAKSSSASKLWIAQGIFGKASGSPSFSVAPLLVEPLAEDIVDLSHTREGLRLLYNGKIVSLDAATAAWNASAPWPNVLTDSLPSASANRLGGALACDWLLDHGNRTSDDHLVLWDDSAGAGSAIWFSKDDGVSFVKLEIGLGDGMTILSASPLVSVPRVLVVARDESSDAVHIIHVHVYDSVVERLATFGQGGNHPALSGDVHVAPMKSPSGELILYTASQLWYSPSVGFSFRRMSLKSFHWDTSSFETASLASDDTIQGVVTSLAGNVAVWTKLGRIFTSSLGLVDAHELYSPLRDGEPISSLVYSPDATLLALQSNDATLSVTQVPVQKRVVVLPNATLASADLEQQRKALHASKEQCPYVKWGWAGEGEKDAFYVDMNDSIEVKLELTHDSAEEGLFISFQTSDHSLVRMRPQDEEITMSADGGRVQHQRTVEVAVPRDISKRTGVGNQSEATGNVVLRASPSRVTATCTDPRKLIQVHVGCPRGRHLRYRAPEAFYSPSLAVVSSECDDLSDQYTGEEKTDFITSCTCSRYKNKVVTLGKSFMDRNRAAQFYQTQGTTVDQVMQTSPDDEDFVEYSYDLDTFGCPTFVPYTAHFLPQLEIWDGDTKVKDVDADFVLIEVHGRKDVYFGQTASQVGCIREPGTWEQKIADADSLEFHKAWGSHNHRSCFTLDGDDGAGAPRSEWEHEPYEILNASASNYITFKNASGETPYQFVAVVVDPDFSFCTLHTTFAVEPYGMPMDSWTTFLIIFYVVLASGLLLGVTYMVHRRDILHAAARDALEDQQRLEQERGSRKASEVESTKKKTA